MWMISLICETRLPVPLLLVFGGYGKLVACFDAETANIYSESFEALISTPLKSPNRKLEYRDPLRLLTVRPTFQ